MSAVTVQATAAALVAAPRGILAADESPATLAKRLAEHGIEASVKNRLAWRELIMTTPGLSRSISGVILHDETLRRPSSSGASVPELLARHGILAGIKVDTGAKPLASCPGELVTEGLDGLRERLKEYVRMGARFAKWRAVIKIDAALPSVTCVEVNAHALARYAALCQEANLTPILEPEVLRDGAYTLQRCGDVTGRVLEQLMVELSAQRVSLDGVLVKSNMVLSGADAPAQASAGDVAHATRSCLERSVPRAVAGIVFLSGGQGAQAATANLAATCASGIAPWPLSFSFARAIQGPAIAAWAGIAANREIAQARLVERADANAGARATTTGRRAA